MTANEQGERLLFLLNRANAGASFSYSDAQLSQALNHAQWHFIKSFIRKTGNPQQEGLEETELRAQGLAPLIKQAKDLQRVIDDSMYPDTRRYKLPEDFMLTLDEYLTFTVSGCDEPVSAEVKVVRHDEYSRWINNIYKKPRLSGVSATVWRMYYNDDVEDTGGIRVDTTVDTGVRKILTAPTRSHEIVFPKEARAPMVYSLRYMKQPAKIVVNKAAPANMVDCELSDQVHITIVEMARNILLDAFKEQKVQSLQDIGNVE